MKVYYETTGDRRMYVLADPSRNFIATNGAAIDRAETGPADAVETDNVMAEQQHDCWCDIVG